MHEKDFYLCLNCNEKANSLYKHTEGKFIKLIECRACGDVVDHYIECERSIVATDVIMQEAAAYKHILHNSDDFRPLFFLKLFLIIVLSEGYVRWSAQQQVGATIKNNEYGYYIVCLGVIIELVAIVLVLLSLLPERDARSPRMVSKAVVLGQSGRLLNIAAIVYRQGSSPFFHAFVNVLVFVSSIQSVRALTFKDRISTSVDVAAALAIGVIASRMFRGFFP